MLCRMKCGRAYPFAAIVRYHQEIVSQNEVRKIYRAKHAKLAKAPPRRRFLSNHILAPLAFPSTMLRTCFARDTVLSDLPSWINFKNVWLQFTSQSPESANHSAPPRSNRGRHQALRRCAGRWPASRCEYLPVSSTYESRAQATWCGPPSDDHVR